MDQAEESALHAVTVAVGNARPHLVDEWEATAVVESLGYTDARVRRNFALADARALGERVFDRLSGRHIPVRTADAAATETSQTLGEGVGGSWIYAIPWVAAFIIDHTVPDGSRMSALPPLTRSLIFSLLVTGGLVYAMSWRARFYVAIGQPGFAAFVCGYFFRLGAIVTVAATATGLIIAGYLHRVTWPYLVLSADEFVILCALWLTFGVLIVRRQHWRVMGASVVGAIGFLVVRMLGLDALTARLVALGAVLAAALVQLPGAFAHSESAERPPSIPIPRLSILFCRVSPFFWYGTTYFCLLFADRFLASGDEALAIDLALTSFLFAMAATDYANVTFSHRLDQAAHIPFVSGSDAFRRVIGRTHLQALTIVGAGFLLTATIVGGLTKGLLAGGWPHLRIMLMINDAGYLLLALGMVNVFALFTLNRPWSAVKAVAASLVLNAATVWAVSRVIGAHYATAGLLVGSAFLLIQSTIVVRRTVDRADGVLAVI